MDMDSLSSENRGMVKSPRNRRRRENRAPPPVLYVGQWIRALGLIPATVAKGLKMNEGYLSQIINNTRVPSVAMLNEIAGFLDIPAEYFKRPPPTSDFLAKVSEIEPKVLERLRKQ